MPAKKRNLEIDKTDVNINADTLIAGLALNDVFFMQAQGVAIILELLKKIGIWAEDVGDNDPYDQDNWCVLDVKDVDHLNTTIVPPQPNLAMFVNRKEFIRFLSTLKYEEYKNKNIEFCVAIVKQFVK